MNNQRGGILSKMIIIPVATACMASLFFLGYYMGKRQARTNQADITVPLPEVVSKNIPTTNDFTFFKTLSDKDNRTVSIELKPKSEASTPARATESTRQARQASKAEPAVSAKQQTSDREQAAPRATSSKMRYTLQTASYQDRAMADEDVRRLKQHGFAAFVVSSAIPGKGTWFRVRLGSFPNKSAAEKLQKDLHSKEGITAFVLAE